MQIGGYCFRFGFYGRKFRILRNGNGLFQQEVSILVLGEYRGELVGFWVMGIQERLKYIWRCSFQILLEGGFVVQLCGVQLVDSFQCQFFRDSFSCKEFFFVGFVQGDWERQGIKVWILGLLQDILTGGIYFRVGLVKVLWGLYRYLVFFSVF